MTGESPTCGTEIAVLLNLENMESARTLGFLTLSIRFSLLLFLFLLVGGCQRSDERRIRILTAGLSHESDTFCPIQTEEKDFTVARGEEALKEKEWAQFLQKAGVELIPTLHASASPFGVVSRGTYEKFKREILDGVRKAGPVDGMYLAMHGALHAEGYEDAQADLVRFLREILGERAVIAASFDLHGNISEGFAQGLNIMTALRTAPHVDGVETQVRAVRLLLEALQKRQKPVPVLVKVPILIPGEKGITGVDRLKSIYGQLPGVSQKQGLLDASIFVGMAWSDVPRASMSVTVVADGEKNREQALREAKRLAALLWEKRSALKFDVPTDTITGRLPPPCKRPRKPCSSRTQEITSPPAPPVTTRLCWSGCWRKASGTLWLRVLSTRPLWRPASEQESVGRSSSGSVASSTRFLASRWKSRGRCVRFFSPAHLKAKQRS